MNLSSMTRQFKSRRKGNSVAYSTKWDLSADALRATCPIVQGLFEKAKREGRIPDTYLFWTQTNAPEITEELVNAGFMKFEFTEKGRAVYSHEVDADLLRETLGWNKN